MHRRSVVLSIGDGRFDGRFDGDRGTADLMTGRLKVKPSSCVCRVSGPREPQGPRGGHGRRAVGLIGTIGKLDPTRSTRTIGMAIRHNHYNPYHYTSKMVPTSIGYAYRIRAGYRNPQRTQV